MSGAVNSLIQCKVDRYNKAKEDVRMSRAAEYLYQLKGMQELLEAMGFQLEMEYDDGDLKCTFV